MYARTRTVDPGNKKTRRALEFESHMDNFTLSGFKCMFDDDSPCLVLKCSKLTRAKFCADGVEYHLNDKKGTLKINDLSVVP